MNKDKMKSQALFLKKKAIENADVILMSSVATVLIVFGTIKVAKSTVDKERQKLTKELTAGNVVVTMGEKHYFTFPIMIDETRIKE